MPSRPSDLVCVHTDTRIFPIGRLLGLTNELSESQTNGLVDITVAQWSCFYTCHGIHTCTFNINI